MIFISRHEIMHPSIRVITEAATPLSSYKYLLLIQFSRNGHELNPIRVQLNMTSRRTSIHITETLILWVALILIGTFINYIAISLLTYHERRVFMGFPNLGPTRAIPLQRKIMRTDLFLKIPRKRKAKHSLKATPKDHNTVKDPRKKTDQAIPQTRDVDESPNTTDITQELDQTTLQTMHTQEKNESRSKTKPQQQGAQTALEDTLQRPISYYLELSKNEVHDKERILYLLRDNAQIQTIDQTTYEALPTWTQVTALYGDKPRIVSKEQCQILQSQGDIADKYLGVAGTFNTGTNLMAGALTQNCALYKKQAKHGKTFLGVRRQVPWGKHVPPKDAEFRANNIVQQEVGVDPKSVLPVVMTRDPFRWLTR
jgi:hypothetical protein